MIDWRRAINFSREAVSSSTRALGSLSGKALLSAEWSLAMRAVEGEEIGFGGVEDAEGGEEDGEDESGAEDAGGEEGVEGEDGAGGVEDEAGEEDEAGAEDGFISCSTWEE
ncbi:MAG TPA: hypothetical protein PKH53_00495, partial [Candidatus Saccharicenans sp.]|nr:hypothetical protein [Candidatus Saccharicenans sp.]